MVHFKINCFLVKCELGGRAVLVIVIVVSCRMINDSALKPTKDMFMKVALEIFSDGKFNWGRVVALFYFACRLVIKVS